MIIDKNVVLQVIGSLMKHPQFLSESDKYTLTPDDFGQRLHKYIFIAIDSLYRSGATHISSIDIDNFLSTNGAAHSVFEKENGIEYLQDADCLSDDANFPYYYNKLKKFNLLNALKAQGHDISEFYIEDVTNLKALDVNEKFEGLTVHDIIDRIKRKILKVEKDFVQNEATETTNVLDGIKEIIADAGSSEDIGFPLQGDLFNEVLSGARKGTFVVRSAASGTGKTRNAVGDACLLAFPFRYDESTEKWVQCGSNKKVLLIITEQTRKEIQKMILAYLTGFNESKFRYGNFSERELRILDQALWVLETYQDNLLITCMPNPTIELVRSIVRENCIMHDIEYVFYDYIFICPSLLNEFKGFSLRNDEILLMLSTALKDLAVELNIFMMTSTQVNANADDNHNIRNESSIAGSRSVINKADVGCVMARPTTEELEVLKQVTEQLGIYPNLVTDVYKVRSGEWNQVRIWSYVDLGNLRKNDLFATDARFNVLTSFNYNFKLSLNWDDEIYITYKEQIGFLNREEWSMIDYEAIVESLEVDKVIKLMSGLGIEPYKETESFVIFPTVCHNGDADTASKKLYFYKDTHLFVCYTECGAMSIFKLLKNIYEARDLEYDWYTDIYQVILNCTPSGLRGPAQNKYRSIRDKYMPTKIKKEQVIYPEQILNCFVKRYPKEWLSDHISKEAMDKFNIMFSISQNKIIIPHYSIDNQLIGIRGRALDPWEIENLGKYMPVQIEDKWYTHPLSFNLYGLNKTIENIRRTGVCYLVEAEKSVLQAENFNRPNCTAAVCGSNLNKYQVELLIKNAQPQEIVICFDNEEEPRQDKYFNKLMNICKKYSNYSNFSFVYDRNGLSKLKDSPTDNGQEIFEKLLEGRVRV